VKGFNFDGTKNSEVALVHDKGYFRAVTGKTGKVAPSRFLVKTVSATIGIRGTDFSVNIVDGKEKIRCHSGAIWVKYDNGSMRNIVSNMLLSFDYSNEAGKPKDIQPPAAVPLSY